MCNYDVIMKAQIIQIGNSQGVRIPKVLLEESGVAGEVELEACSEGILIRNLNKPRSSWDEIFQLLKENEEEEPLEDPAPGVFEKNEWQW